MSNAGVQDTLARSGLIKYFQVPLMQTLRLLLETLLGFWDIGSAYSIIQG